MTTATTTTTATTSAPPSDISPAWRRIMLVAGGGMIAASTLALVKGVTGLAPTAAEAKDMAVMIHLAAVLPAIPLGLHVLLSRKGDRRHRMLGGIWMLLMLVTAISALFIRHMNGGGFSVLHLFVPFTVVTMVRSIAAARQGRIGAHKRHLIGLFAGALLLPGLFSFLPGRIMWLWLVG